MDRDFICINCGEGFKAGAWYGCRGNKTRKHVVESKTYYSENDRLCVNAVPSSTMLGAQGERISVPGIIVTFMGGTFHTQDAEVQEVLDRRCPMTKEQYVDMRASEAVKNNRLREQVREQQVLIDQLKAQVADNKAPKDTAVAEPVESEEESALPQDRKKGPKTRAAG